MAHNIHDPLPPNICPLFYSQLLSPMSAGLFHGAISQSGVVISKILEDLNAWSEAQVCLSFTLLP